MKITFYDRDGFIYIRAFHKKQMIRTSTGIKMPSYSRFKGELLAGDTSEIAAINSILLRKKAEIIEGFSQSGDLYQVKPAPELATNETEDTLFLTHLMYKYVNMMASGELKSKKGKPYSASTIRSYQYAADTLAQFKRPISLEDFIVDGKSIPERKAIGEHFNRYFDRFTEYMIGLGLQVNTRVDIVNIITTIINYWADKLYIQVPRPPKLTGYEPPIIALDDEFLRKFVLDEHKLYDTFKPEYRYLWEITAVMMVTSLRVSDAVSLTKEDFIIGKEIYLVKENAKTGEFTEMPLPKTLTDKMFENLARLGDIFTPIKYNAKQAFIRREYKEFFKQYPEMHVHVTVKKADLYGKRVSVTKPMYEWVHPHMMRKSAITAMLSNDVSEDHVKFCSGHRPGSKAFERYKGFVEKRYKSEVNNYQNKMFS
jgi:integrase